MCFAFILPRVSAQCSGLWSQRFLWSVAARGLTVTRVSPCWCLALVNTDPSHTLWSHRKATIFCFQNHCLQRKKENFSQQVLFGRKGFQGPGRKKKFLSVSISKLKERIFFFFFCFALFSVKAELVKVLKWENHGGRSDKHLSNDVFFYLFESKFKLLTSHFSVLGVTGWYHTLNLLNTSFTKLFISSRLDSFKRLAS